MIDEQILKNLINIAITIAKNIWGEKEHSWYHGSCEDCGAKDVGKNDCCWQHNIKNIVLKRINDR